MNIHPGNFLALLVLCTLAPLATAKEAGLDRWIDSELLPYLGGQLSEHPRFRGETVMFVVLDGSAPTARSNALALSLRDRLLDAARDFRGVKIGWLQESRLDSGPVDCSRDDVHYYIGIELLRRLDGRYELRVRAQDVEDRSWVAGFAKSWRGRLNRAQQQAVRTAAIDDTFLGAREVPFTLAQVDLLARRVAHDLSCELMRQTHGEYIVAETASHDGQYGNDDAFDATVELIGNYIASHPSVDVTGDDEQVNAELAGKAFQIDGTLHQFWLRVTPNGRDGNLATLSASAYVTLPETRQANARSPAPVRPQRLPPARPTPPDTFSMPRIGDDAILGALSVAEPAHVRQCGSRSALLQATSDWSSRRHCSLLKADLYANAVVFVLQHQAQLGLVRPGGDECRARTQASVVRRGESLRFPVAAFRADTGELRATDDWHVVPRRDTYYVVAVADAGSARRLANHIDRLPIRCGSRSRPGLRNGELRDWLEEFAMLAAQSESLFDWRALELKNIY